MNNCFDEDIEMKNISGMPGLWDLESL